MIFLVCNLLMLLMLLTCMMWLIRWLDDVSPEVPCCAFGALKWFLLVLVTGEWEP